MLGHRSFTPPARGSRRPERVHKFNRRWNGACPPWPGHGVPSINIIDDVPVRGSSNRIVSSSIVTTRSAGSPVSCWARRHSTGGSNSSPNASTQTPRYLRFRCWTLSTSLANVRAMEVKRRSEWIIGGSVESFNPAGVVFARWHQKWLEHRRLYSRWNCTDGFHEL